MAELLDVCWLEVNGEIDTSLLSTDTWYATYLVYKLTPDTYGFEYDHAKVSMRLHENQTVSQPKRVLLSASQRQTLPDVPKHRQDGWLEIELGDFYNKEGQEGNLGMKVMGENGTSWKSGLIIQGIEIRPKTR